MYIYIYIGNILLMSSEARRQWVCNAALGIFSRCLPCPLSIKIFTCTGLQVIVITVISCVPVTIGKYVQRKLSPPVYVKVSPLRMSVCQELSAQIQSYACGTYVGFLSLLCEYSHAQDLKSRR